MIERDAGQASEPVTAPAMRADAARPLRLVLDTNVVFAMVVRPAPWAKQLTAQLDSGAVLLSSDATWAELERILNRMGHLARPGRRRIAASLDWVRARAERIENPAEVRACSDPSDDKFLGLAVAGRAHRLLTADRALLALDPFCGVRIERPWRFVRWLAGGGGDRGGGGAGVSTAGE